MAILRNQVVHTVFFVMDLTLDICLISTQALTNLFAAAERNILIDAAGRDVVSASNSVVAAVGINFL